MAAIPQHEIIVLDPSTGLEEWESLRQQCYDVRIDVFHHEQGFPVETEIDDLEDISTHFLLRLVPSLKPVGTIRYTRFKDYSKLSRLVVLKEYRQYKFGRELVETLHRYAIQDAQKAFDGTVAPKAKVTSTDSDPKDAHDDIIRIISHSQIPVKAFYSRLGYEPEGEEFDEDGAPHQCMVTKLSLSLSG